MTAIASKPLAPTHQLDWIAERLKIISKHGKKVSLEPNLEQRQLMKTMAVQRAAGFPIRIIILKARQVGMSTITDGYFFERILHCPNLRGLICAHDDKSSTTLFDMVKMFYEELPANEQLPADYLSRKEIAFEAPHRSRLEVQTAGKKHLGRSQMLHYLHCSELAFWPNDVTTLNAVSQSVPDDFVDSIVVLESTANGVGGAFYTQWKMAVERMRKNSTDYSGFIPLFFSWLDHPEYTKAIPLGMSVNNLDDDERHLRSIGATDEQLFWRRGIIESKCNGDVDMFKQEYPSSPDEAFRMSGRPAVDPRIVNHYRNEIRPGTRIRLEVLDDTTVRAVPTEDEPYWEVWDEPRQNGNYAVAGDVAEGILSDPDNRNSKPDFSVGVVLDRKRFSICARYRGRPQPDVFGRELLKMAMWYNWAWVTPELNSCGFGALGPLKDAFYPFIYTRQQSEDFQVPEDMRQYGHKTTPQNRSLMIDEWLADMRPDWDGSFEGRLLCYSADYVEEMEAFICDKSGKRQHRAGGFDDELFATMIVLWIHKRTPRFTADENSVRTPAAPAYAYTGGSDPGIEGTETPPDEYMR